MTANSFNACFVKIEHTPTRGVYKVILEIPEEQANYVLNSLGGLPYAKDSTWVKVSRIYDDNDDKETLDDKYKKYLPSMPQEKLDKITNLSQPSVLPSVPTKTVCNSIGQERNKWHDMKPSQQAGLRCKDYLFQVWIRAHAKWGKHEAADFLDFDYEGNARQLIISHCGVDSRSELNTNTEAAATWQEIDKDFIWYLQHEVKYGK